MNREIEVGDYVIMNDSDKPCTRLIAKVMRIDGGRAYGRYICERVNMREPRGSLDRVTKVSDFGVELVFDDNTVTAKQVRPSTAIYPDGEPREWQPLGENPTQKLHKPRTAARS